ncbi:hypothetical protein QNM99_11770 [Pseudomonas sp. PCH446]
MGVHIKDKSDLPPIGFAFATRQSDPVLSGLVERVLDSIDNATRREILARWTTGFGSDIAQQRISLTAAELAWIDRHPRSQWWPSRIRRISTRTATTAGSASTRTCWHASRA